MGRVSTFETGSHLFVNGRYFQVSELRELVVHLQAEHATARISSGRVAADPPPEKMPVGDTEPGQQLPLGTERPRVAAAGLRPTPQDATRRGVNPASGPSQTQRAARRRASDCVYGRHGRTGWGRTKTRRARAAGRMVAVVASAPPVSRLCSVSTVA